MVAIGIAENRSPPNGSCIPQRDALRAPCPYNVKVYLLSMPPERSFIGLNITMRNVVSPPDMRRRGFALVLVLIVLTLVATTATFFMAAAGRERAASETYAESTKVQMLADYPVDIVTGLISAATVEGANLSTPAARSWTSQPGAIRTFDQSGKPASFYRLYSWENPLNPVPAGSYDPLAADNLPPDDWDTQRSIFVNLNEPSSDVYPIVDPSAVGSVDGFSLDSSSPGADAPMPVKWLYVLSDGSLVTPTGGPTEATISGAAKDNPVVGRIAFWTDDETSKVNINTASEGSFWDVPKAATADEMQFAGNAPMAGEYARLPGHPAMTSLSAVFPSLDPGVRWSSISDYRTRLRDIYDIAPRIAWSDASSRGGTWPVDGKNYTYTPTSTIVNQAPRLPVISDTDRLYATPDELVFKPDRSAQVKVPTAELQKRKFFLTASSRAPETTLFDTPRVSLWPITWPWNSHYFAKRGSPPTPQFFNSAPLSNNPWMAPEERLLAFAATTNRGLGIDENRWFFQRQNPDSATHDWDEIERNVELFDYLADLTTRSVPGFGGALRDEYAPGDVNFILANLLNHIRSSVNQYTLAGTTASTLLYSFTPVAFRAAPNYRESNAFRAVPLVINGTQTTGSYPVLREATLLFIATQREEPVNVGVPTDPNNWQNLINFTPGARPIGSQTKKMQAILLLNFANDATTSSQAGADVWLRTSGTSFQINGSPIGLPKTSPMTTQYYMGITDFRGPTGIRYLYRADDPANPFAGNPPKTIDNTAAPTNWNLVSDLVTIDPTSTDFSFQGSELTIEVLPATSNRNTAPGASAEAIATYTLDFSAWDGTFPVPLAPRWVDGDEAARPSRSAYPAEVAASLQTNLFTDPIERSGNTPNASYAYKDVAGVLISPNFRHRLFVADARRISGEPWSAPEEYPIAEGTTSKKLFGVNAEQALSIISPYDVAISMVADPGAVGSGDPRLRPEGFAKIDAVFSGSPRNLLATADVPTRGKQWHFLSGGSTNPWATGYPASAAPQLLEASKRSSTVEPELANNPARLMGRYGRGSAGGSGVNNLGAPGSDAQGARFLGTYTMGDADFLGRPVLGDFSSGPGSSQDGGFFVRPDQDFQALHLDAADSAPQTPYFVRSGTDEAAALGSFSPNRQIASPIGILGSIPSSSTVGWQTLAFATNPAISAHPGISGNAPDHLWLDLFWMPVVEPYPISDQFSTAGKVNLNHQILPFPYIHRKTALHAALKPIQIGALENRLASIYKAHVAAKDYKSRWEVDVAETLKLMDDRFFDNGDVFRSASQICEIPLVPKGISAGGVAAFWADKLLTSDTYREGPYDQIYSRLTTKSNTFTVHWVVQSLKHTTASASAAKWAEDRDVITSELRGATTIERYLDPDATDLPDYASAPLKVLSEPLGKFYKWRVVNSSRFAPATLP